MGAEIPQSSKLTVVPGAEVFATGDYPQGKYTLRDLCEMAQNVNRLGPNGLSLHAAPIGLLNTVGVGHEEPKTDEPACGIVKKARVKPYFDPATKQWEGVLVADLDDVPEELAEKIKSKRFRKVSAEIYDNFSDDHGNKYGKAIRRVSLLGFEPPAVKRLKDLPQPVQKFGERFRITKRVQKSPGVYVCFAEWGPQPMNTEAVKIAVKSELPDMSEEQLNAIAKAVSTVLGDPVVDTPADVAPADTTMADDMPAETETPTDDPALSARQEMIDKLVAMGQDPMSLDAMSDEDLEALLASLETSEGDVEQFGDMKKKMFSEIAKIRKEVKDIVAASKAEIDKAKAEVGEYRKFAEAIKRDQVNEIITDAVTEGRLLPSQADLYREQLLKADRNTVRTFGEGKTATQDTEFNRLVTYVKTKQKIAVFGERVQQPKESADMDEMTLQVKKFAEEKYGGTSSEFDVGEYVKKFAELRKKNPKITAEMYTGHKL